MNHQDPISVQTIRQHICWWENKRLFWHFACLGSNNAVLFLIKYGKHGNWQRAHVGKGSGMALAASDGGQDCCRVSKARCGGAYTEGTGHRKHGMTKLCVAGRNRAKHGVGEVTNRSILIPTLFHLTLLLWQHTTPIHALKGESICNPKYGYAKIALLWCRNTFDHSFFLEVTPRLTTLNSIAIH